MADECLRRQGFELRCAAGKACLTSELSGSSSAQRKDGEAKNVNLDQVSEARMRLGIRRVAPCLMLFTSDEAIS